MRIMRRSAILAGLLVTLSAGAHDCRVGDVKVNPDNGSTYQSLTGIMVCRDEDGTVKSEQELQSGEFIGLDRRRDLWGSLVERHVNANGNSHGAYKAFWPDGTLKQEANYDDGDVVGLSRSFHKNGQLERASFSAAGKALASVEYDATGALRDFRCGDRSYLEQDRALCGFGGKAVTTPLFRNGREVERVTFRDGKPVESQSIGERGVVVGSRRLEADGEVRRTAYPDGKPQSETRIVDGFIVAERTWYMNGKLRTEIVREPNERDSRATAREFRDDGTLRQETLSIGRRTNYLALHDETGALKEASDFDADGKLARKRRYAADGSVTSDEMFFPDGSRRTD